MLSLIALGIDDVGMPKRIRMAAVKRAALTGRPSAVERASLTSPLARADSLYCFARLFVIASMSFAR